MTNVFTAHSCGRASHRVTALSSFLGTVLSQQGDIYNIKLDNGKEYLYSRTEIERYYRRKSGRVC